MFPKVPESLEGLELAQLTAYRDGIKAAAKALKTTLALSGGEVPVEAITAQADLVRLSEAIEAKETEAADAAEEAARAAEALAALSADDDDDAVEAKSVCAQCGVRVACLEYALVSREKSGVWGGATERERRRLIRQRRRTA